MAHLPAAADPSDFAVGLGASYGHVLDKVFGFVERTPNPVVAVSLAVPALGAYLLAVTLAFAVRVAADGYGRVLHLASRHATSSSAAPLHCCKPSMAAALPDLSKFVAAVAWGTSLLLAPLLGFLERSPARSPAFDAAAVAAVLAITVAYLVGVFFVYLYVLTVQAAAPLPASPPSAPWRFAALGVTVVGVLLVFVEVPIVALLLYAGDGW